MAAAMRLAVGVFYKRKFASVTKMPQLSRTLTSIFPAGRVRRPLNVLQYLPRHVPRRASAASHLNVGRARSRNRHTERLADHEPDARISPNLSNARVLRHVNYVI